MIDIFGPGISSFELFGILVAVAVVIILIAVVAEALRGKTEGKSQLKFFVLALGMTLSGLSLFFDCAEISIKLKIIYI